MWFFIALFVAGFILTAFLSPKIKLENAQAKGLDDFSFPRSDEGDPVTRFYGTLKLTSPNTIGLGNFRAEPIKKKVKTGLFSSKKVITGYKYYSGVDLAWALGPGVVYRKLWFGENLVWSGCLYEDPCVNVININLPELYGGSNDGNRGGIAGNIAMYCGNFDQPADVWNETHLGADCPAYVGIAHMVFRDFWWGNSPQIDAVSCEAAYFTNGLGLADMRHIMPNGLDANIVEVLFDIFQTDWGNLGYDPAKINVEQWRTVALQAFGEGNGISISISNATEAKDAVKQILRQLNAIIFEEQTTGLVELKLLRNDYDILDLPVLTPSEIIEVRNYTKKLWSETNNVVRLKYIDREAGYVDDKVAIAKDFALLRFQGKQRPVEINMPGVKEAGLANAIAARELSNLNVPLYSCELSMNRVVSSLRPGDPFILVWPEYGISQMVMRIRKMGNGSLENGRITLSVVQDEYALDATVISAPVPSGYVPNSYAPQDVEDFALFELPAFLDYNAGLATPEGQSSVASLVKAPSSYTLGFNAYIEEGTDDVEVLNMAPYANTGQLVAPLGRFEGWDDGVVAEVLIDNIGNVSEVINAEDIRLGGNLFVLGNELLAYESATDNEDGTVTLNNVHRAMFDTGWFAHAADDVLYFFEGQEGFFDDAVVTGEEFSVYFIDRTATGSSPADSALVTPFTPVGRVSRVIAPDYATADGNRAAWQIFTAGATIPIDARPRNRANVTEAWFEDDAAATAEAGTTYRISFELDGVVTVIADDQALPYDFVTTNEDHVGNIVVHIEAKKDGLYSIASAPMPVIVLPNNGELTIDYDLVLIDGERIGFDA